MPISERLSPAVVNISSAQRGQGAATSNGDTYSRKFSPQSVSLGSGFIIDLAGLLSPITTLSTTPMK
ncbi:MAG: hypothetical protein R3C40_09675 [Parvularculaceae bacterium]